MSKSGRVRQAIGSWTLQSKIGNGGNGDVWRVSRTGHPDRALKLLRRVDEITYARFAAEIDALKQNADVDGVVPILDSFLPPDIKAGTPWYVMPLGVPAGIFLKGRSAEEVVSAFLPLVDTLTELHSRQVSHRDIKPENILAIDGRLHFADFGLVKFPGRDEITPERRDVGPKFTMAPEMRREARTADGRSADVFSLAKTLWVLLTGRQLGFDGQYNALSDIALSNFLSGTYTTSLDFMLSKCTENDPGRRPPVSQIRVQLNEWLGLLDDFHTRNLVEWTELMQRLFPLGAPVQATWTGAEAICAILNEVAKVPSLNHMFYPSGGGNTITSVSRAGEQDFIELDALDVSVLKPRKLSWESFSGGAQWNYFRLEAEEVDPKVDEGSHVYRGHEFLTEIEPGKYGPPGMWEYDQLPSGKDIPETLRPISRYLGGSFVIFSTRSPYNLDPGTYDARHNRMSEMEFRDYIRRQAARTPLDTDDAILPRRAKTRSS